MGVGISGYKSNTEYIYVDKTPNPNPRNFKVLSIQELGDFVILLVKYPDCTTYEGLKVIVYETDADSEYFLGLESLDPHFSDKGLAPVARFEPTHRGWQLACQLCSSFDGSTIKYPRQLKT